MTQKYYTPAPGRSPSSRVEDNTDTVIIDREDYKLITKLREFRPYQWVLTISQWYPEQGWHHDQYFLEPEELARFRELFE
jgi:hypothetical protein